MVRCNFLRMHDHDRSYTRMLSFIIPLFLGLLVIAAGAMVSATMGQRNQPNGGAVNETEQLEEADHAQAVVSQHRIATEAGIRTLERGGTAADAAVAVAATLSVVEPWFSSALGGGTWALYYNGETGEVTSIDGVGPVGSRASLGSFRPRSETPGMHQAIVPGAWDGWMLWLQEYGQLDLGEVLEPAIQAARNGYPVSAEMAQWLRNQEGFIRGRPDTARVYIQHGQLLAEGETAFQRDMATTFELLAEAYDSRRAEGRDAAIQAARDYFYRGPVAEAIVAFSDQNDGFLTMDDFRTFAAEIRQPISVSYRNGIEVYQNPPNSQGITMLMALQILKSYDFGQWQPNDPDAVHLQIEALKLAFADRHHQVGDPARVAVPVERLLSDEYAAEQRQRIQMNQAQRWPIRSGISTSPGPADSDDGHTTTFHVVDRYGNGAAVTTSLGARFHVVGNTGIHINERMRMVSLEEGNPNQLTPGYKVRHTSNPYLALRNGQLYILGGNTGVDTQPQGQLQQFISVVEFGLTAQEAVARPRFVTTAFPSSSHPSAAANTLRMERGLPQSLITELRNRGHSLSLGAGVFGSANMIVLDPENGSVQIGAEPRIEVSEGTYRKAAE
jgi:gamma-glutamyltranspeptidase / glutathione hydrolase